MGESAVTPHRWLNAGVVLDRRFKHDEHADALQISHYASNADKIMKSITPQIASRIALSRKAFRLAALKRSVLISKDGGFLRSAAAMASLPALACDFPHFGRVHQRESAFQGH